MAESHNLTATQARQAALRRICAFQNLSVLIRELGVIQPILRFFCVWVQHRGSTQGISRCSYPHPHTQVLPQVPLPARQRGGYQPVSLPHPEKGACCVGGASTEQAVGPLLEAEPSGME